jgi:signal transduction histidine kinase/CheY-like chemotaxis protein
MVSVLAAAGLGWLLAPWVGDQAPYLLFTVAVMLSARYGGLWSGVTSTVLGGLVAFSLFVSSPGAPAQWLLLGVYLAVGICLSLLAESQRTTTFGVGTAAQRHAERLRLLGEAARRVASAGPEPKGLAGALAEQAASLVGDTAEVHFVSEDGRALQPVAVHRPNEDTKTVALPAALPAGEMHRYLHGFSSEHRLAVPLRIEDRTLGTLALERSQGPAFNEEDQALAAGLASSASLALLRASDHRQWQATAAEAKKREESLQEAADQLRESSRLKDEFLATVAHELRTPLGAMLGWAHILRDEAVDKETASRALDAIVRNAGIQTRLISDLLDISRIVAGTMRVEMQTVELVAVIRAALETVRPTAEAKGVVLSATVDAEAGPVTGDPSRLQQVLWNLLSNSIKFTPRGGTVAVRVQGLSEQVEVTVEDSGPGIPPEFLPHVFERFRQAGGAKTRGKGGLGLGLAIVRHLVELHGGTIAVANRENAPGAAFTVRLPIRTLRPGEAPAQIAPMTTVPSDSAELPSLEGVRVLVVDDGDESREMVAMVLEKRGAQVTGVPYASEALTTMAEVRPDVLLADLELGDANGDSLIQKIRALPAGEGGSTPAAALGSYARAEDRTRALLAGFQIHLAKPVRPAELVAAVASLSGRTQKAAVVEARA